MRTETFWKDLKKIEEREGRVVVDEEEARVRKGGHMKE